MSRRPYGQHVLWGRRGWGCHYVPPLLGGPYGASGHGEGADGTVDGIPVMGAFVVRDGNFVRWTDYFHTGLVGKMLTGEDYADLVPATY